MKKSKEVWSHLAVGAVWFLLVAFLRGKVDWGLLGLGLGAFLGIFLLDIDHLFYWFLTNPEKEDSQEAKRIWETKDKGFLGFKQALKKLWELLSANHKTHMRLVFHSLLGQIVLLILAVFVLTSSGSLFGSALILSLNLHLLKDEWEDFFKSKEHLADWLFWQVREPKLEEHLGVYLGGVSFIFLLLTGFLI